MDQLKQQAPHLVLCAIGVGALLVLALGHEINGDTAFGAIFGITGLGVGGALGLQSSSGTPATPTVNVPLNVQATSTPSPSPTASKIASAPALASQAVSVASDGSGSNLTPSATS